MAHAGSGGNQYADVSSFMGYSLSYALRALDGEHHWQMGWYQNLDDQTATTANASGSYQIAPQQESIPAANAASILRIAVIAVIATAGYLKFSNPLKQYSTDKYWQVATLEDTYKILTEALLPGNTNGSVLMWAAMNTSDPRIIAALVERGADVHYEDLTGRNALEQARRFNNTPVIEMLETLTQY